MKKGISVIEVLIAMSVLSILTAILVPNLRIGAW